MALSSLQLEAFYCLAQTGHFGRAAERLHVTQSALSQRIANLEEQLETALFIRDRRGARLTDTGLELLRYCQAKEGLESEFTSRLKSSSPTHLAGKIRIAGFSSVMDSVIVPILGEILQCHLDVRLLSKTRELHELPDLLRRSEVDFAILDHVWEREGILSIPLGEERNILIEKKGYQGPDIYLDHDEEDQTTVRYFKLHRKKWSGARHYLDDIQGILQGVRLGFGRAVVPGHLIKNEKDIRILNSNQYLPTQVCLHYQDQPYYTRLHQLVVKTLATKSQKLLEKT